MKSSPQSFNLSRRGLLAMLMLGRLDALGSERIRVGKVRFQVERRGGETGHASRRYLHIHGNETTARTVLTEHLRGRAGVALFVENRSRTIRVERLIIDPNRMFSPAGAEASLRRLNPQAESARLAKALNRLEQDLPALLEALLPPPGGLLISMHNNSQGYNIQQEIPLSERHHLPIPDEPNNFFLATDNRDYAALASGPFNGVLQTNPPSADDGSLSRLCAARGIRYVNLEAILGATDRQRAMIAWLDAALPGAYAD